MAFKKAERRNAKLRMAISGPSGTGKTFGALLLAKEMGSKVALMDSERGSASKYAQKPGSPESPGNWDFDVEDLEEHSIQTYLEKISEAAAAGYDVLVIDSYSHSWAGRGGALETVDKMGGWVKGGKVVSPLVQRLVDAILSYPGHVIATLRSKAEHVIEKDDKGKASIRKMGMATVARDGTDYEFDVMLDLTTDGGIMVSKSRCSAVAAAGVYSREDIPRIAKTLRAWLSEGAEVSQRDTMAAAIRFAGSGEALQALVPELAKMSPEDRAVLKPVFLARKNEFAGVEG